MSRAKRSNPRPGLGRTSRLVGLSLLLVAVRGLAGEATGTAPDVLARIAGDYAVDVHPEPFGFLVLDGRLHLKMGGVEGDGATIPPLETSSGLPDVTFAGRDEAPAKIGLMLTYYQTNRFTEVESLAFPEAVVLPNADLMRSFDRPPYRIEWKNAKRTAVVPFRMTEPLPVFLVAVDGRPLQVLLDTGADTLIVDDEIATDLGTEPVAPLAPESYRSYGFIQDGLLSHRFLRRYASWTLDFDAMEFLFAEPPSARTSTSDSRGSSGR